MRVHAAWSAAIAIHTSFRFFFFFFEMALRIKSVLWIFWLFMFVKHTRLHLITNNIISWIAGKVALSPVELVFKITELCVFVFNRQNGAQHLSQKVSLPLMHWAGETGRCLCTTLDTQPMIWGCKAATTSRTKYVSELDHWSCFTVPGSFYVSVCVCLGLTSGDLTYFEARFVILNPS